MTTGKEYLDSIIQRMIDFDNTRNDVTNFILENQIKNLDLMTDLFISGFLYKAHLRGETLTESDIEILLGNEESYDYDEDLEFILDEDWSHLTINEVLTTVCEKSDYC